MDVIGCGANAHQQMPDLRPLGIGVEIQLPDLGSAGKATAAAHGDGRRLVRFGWSTSRLAARRTRGL